MGWGGRGAQTEPTEPRSQKPDEKERRQEEAERESGVMLRDEGGRWKSGLVSLPKGNSVFNPKPQNIPFKLPARNSFTSEGPQRTAGST